MDKKNTRFFRITAKIISNVFTYVLLSVAVLLVIPQAFGVRMFSVTTPSMTPSYPVGNFIVTIPTTFEDIKTNDVITYRFNNVFVTHRVIEKSANGYSFITKGDANNSADPGSVVYQSVVGVVKLNIPKVGFIAMIFSTMQGKILIIGLLIAFMLLSSLFKKLFEPNENREEIYEKE